MHSWAALPGSTVAPYKCFAYATHQRLLTHIHYHPATCALANSTLGPPLWWLSLHWVCGTHLYFGVQYWCMYSRSPWVRRCDDSVSIGYVVPIFTLVFSIGVCTLVSEHTASYLSLSLPGSHSVRTQSPPLPRLMTPPRDNTVSSARQSHVLQPVMATCLVSLSPSYLSLRRPVLPSMDS